MTGRAVVLGGGGVAGIAWLVGLVAALRADEVELAAADTLIGTSAGSAVAAVLATDQLSASARQQQQPGTPERMVEFDMDAFLGRADEAAREATSRQDAARRMANLPLLQHDVGATERRAIVAARLPEQRWPDRDLRLCAVAQDDGERVVFDRNGGVDLVDAVTASCAVPGVWPPVSIGGRAFVDGGAHSMTNADVAAGADRVLILVPAALTDQQTTVIRSERTRLGSAVSLVITADEASLAAFGPNPLDPSRRPAAYTAGEEQARRVVDEVRPFWVGGS